MFKSMRKWIPCAVGALILLLGAEAFAQVDGAARAQRRNRRPMQRRGVVGKVTAIQERSFDMTVLARRRALEDRAGAAMTAHVNLTDNTRVVKKIKGEPRDLTADSFIAVIGQRENNKTHAKGILKFAALSGASEQELQAMASASMASARMLIGPLPNRLSQGQSEGQAPARRLLPLFGKLTSDSPLTLTTRTGAKWEIMIEPDTRIWIDTPATFNEIKEGNAVSVAGRPARAGQPSSPGAGVARTREIEARFISVLPELPKAVNTRTRRPLGNQ